MGLPNVSENNDEFEFFFELSPDLLCIAGFDGFFKKLNSSWERVLGFSEADLLNRPFLDFVHPEDRARTQTEALRLISEWTPSRFENRYQCKDGTYRSFIWQSVAVREHQRIYAIAREKSSALARTQEILNAIIQAAPAAIIALDREAKVTMWNPAAERIYGWSAAEVLGGGLPYISEGVSKAEFESRANEALQGKPLHDLKAKRHRKDGKEIEVSLSVAPMKDEKGAVFGHVGIAIDVTETKMLEKQLFRAQRMNSLGALAGGIAHDLNNILAPILMSSQLLQTKFPNPENQWLLDSIETSARRGAGLAKQILTFARGLQGERAPVQIRHVIREVEGVLHQSLSKGIKIITNVPTDLWTLMADANQLHQVVLNLCINARDAMPDDGTITVSAENVILDETYATLHQGAEAGPCVVLSVSDTGRGIPADDLEKIFEPFFTTKEPGKGTGLGLSTSLAIVRAHSGFIDVRSEPGRGTSFKVYLPAKPSEAAVRTKDDAGDIPMGNGDLILIVDDEAAVRNIAKATLEAYNYRVITAEDGADGIAAFAQNKDAVQLILSDNNMPVMDGTTMLRVIAKMKPDVKVICVSGTVTGDDTADTLAGLVTSFLPKPFTAKQLLRAVSACVNANSGSGT